MKVIKKRVIETPQKVYDLSIDGNHNYILDNGLVVHNSGKGFTVDNFLRSESYKVFDVDELKKKIVKMDSMKKKYPWIIGYDEGNPEHVKRLHSVVKAEKLDDRYLELMMKSADQSRTLPNYLFDKTGKDISDVTKVSSKLINIGYKPEDIHLIWALTDYAIAVSQNSTRPRVVPDDIMLLTHTGAASTMYDIINNTLPSDVNGDIYVILGGEVNTSYYLDPKTGDPRLTTGKGIGKKPKKARAVPLKKGGFKYIQIKTSGKPITKESKIQDMVAKWMKDHVPKSSKLNKIFGTD